jgi:hypothetical protein
LFEQKEHTEAQRQNAELERQIEVGSDFFPQQKSGSFSAI